MLGAGILLWVLIERQTVSDRGEGEREALFCLLCLSNTVTDTWVNSEVTWYINVKHLCPSPFTCFIYCYVFMCDMLLQTQGVVWLCFQQRQHERKSQKTQTLSWKKLKYARSDPAELMYPSENTVYRSAPGHPRVLFWSGSAVSSFTGVSGRSGLWCQEQKKNESDSEINHNNAID